MIADLSTRPYHALRHREFRRVWLSQLVSQTGSQMQSVALHWHAYLLTGSPLALGFVGLTRALPTILFSLWGGVVADRRDRRHVMLAAQSVMTVGALTLAGLTVSHRETLVALYLFSNDIGTFKIFPGAGSYEPADRHVVAVDLPCFPTESAPLVGERIDTDDLLDAAALRDLVVVDDCREVREPVVRGRHRRFPVGPLMQLSVTEHDEGVEGLLLDAGPERHAHRHRETVPERTGAHLHTRDLDVGMHAERRFEGIELVEDCVVDETRLRQHRAQRGICMSLGEHEAVALGPIRLGRANAHAMEVKGGKDVGRRSGAADVSATPGANCTPDIAAHLARFALQFPDQVVSRFVHGRSRDGHRFCRWIVAEKR
jgi:hypothetical protein